MHWYKQAEYQIFLALLLAHVTGDFPLQSGRMVAAKSGLEKSAFVAHALIHLLLSVAALALFTSTVLWQPGTIGALAVLVLGHTALDVAKSVAVRWRPSLDGAALYLVDQLLHVAIVGVATAVAVQALPAFDAAWNRWLELRGGVLVTTLIVAATVFPAGYLIRYLLAPLSAQLASSGDEDPAGDCDLAGLANAGLYLGWLERGLLVVAFAVGSLTAVGLIVGAKSIARFPAFRTRAFAEYFLIGTLLSVAIAAVGGWILRLALYGT